MYICIRYQDYIVQNNNISAMIIRYLLLCICTAHFAVLCMAQSPLTNNPIHSTLLEKGIEPEKAIAQEFDIVHTIALLKDAPLFNKKGTETKGVPLMLIIPELGDTKIYLHEAPVSQPAHYQKYPNNKTYKITSSDNPYIKGRLAISPRGIRGLIYTDGATILIEPIEENNHVIYTYHRSDMHTFQCDADMSTHIKSNIESQKTTSNIGEDLIEYTIAIASSGEWSNERDNDLTVINDDINTYLAALNAIYENELSTTFILNADNDDLIFFDPETDGLEVSNRTATAHSVISGIIPANDYDIGHVFYEIPFSGSGATGSGVAGLGVTCKDNRKAEGWSGLGGNYSVAFFMDIFAHEVGHQFNAAHSFYGTSNFCSGTNRSPGSGYEPGSGNSMMSYEGICQQNGACTQNHNITPEVSTVYFHAHSVEEMTNYTTNWTCGVENDIANSPPVVSVPTNKSIPIDTPFEITGSATDAQGDAIVYAWEEYDTDNLSLNCPDGEPDDAAMSTTAPLFRTFDPSADGNYRSFPQPSDLINNVHTVGEILPLVARDIKLRLTARDFNVLGGGVGFADMTISVTSNSGPFKITTANDGSAYFAGDVIDLTWDVNDTDLPPVNCNNVTILYSDDGGLTYPTTLAESTPNDGIHQITLPAIATTEGRIKIKATDNYFFDITDNNISIYDQCIVDAGQIINDDAITADAGDPILALNLLSGVATTSTTGELESNAPSTNLNCENQNTNACSSFSLTPRYNDIKIAVDQTGSYTFTRSAGYTSLMNLYEIEHDATAVCDNWLTSSGLYNPGTGFISISSSMSDNLTAGEVYEVKFSAFYNNSIGNYTISYTNSVGGTLYELSAVEPQGYTHAYVVINSSDEILQISTEPNLTDENIFTGDTYTIYGISYFSSIDIQTYIGSTYTSLIDDINNETTCGDITSNSKTITINGCTPSTKIVTSASDDGGAGTLRSLISNSCPGDMILFGDDIAPNTTIILNGDIELTNDVTIDGSDVSNLQISGGFMDRIFTVPPMTTVTFKDVLLKNGFTDPNGGAIYNQGVIKLDGVIFENNFDQGNISPYSGDGEVIIQGGTTLIKD